MRNKKILVIGSSNTDMVIKSGRLPIPGETVLGGEFLMCAGGKGANQAVAAARLGGDVSFLCKVGNDVFGDNSIRGYEKDGIVTTHILRSEKPSGVALILVDGNGENSISVAPGANGDFSVDDVECLSSVIVEADIVVLQLEIPVSTVLRAAHIAHDAGAYVILNPAPACELPDEIFPFVSLMVPNQTEISLMTGIEVKDEASARLAVGVLREKGVGEVILTLGSRGSIVSTGGDCLAVPAPKVKAVDTTAAGDTFCGALCVSLSQGNSLVESARFATRAAALTVQRMGAQKSIPYLKEII